MAKIMKKVLSATLALVMLSAVALPAFATISTSGDNVWHGDNVKLDITKGDGAYTYMLFGDRPNYYYYETSNHTVLKEATGGGAVHVLSVIDTNKYTGEWTPNDIYEFGKSNYDIVYCCDSETGSEAGDYYKRLNLEDSEYFKPEDAKRLRAILANAYPYLSVEEAKAALKEAGFEQADELDRSELITATQAAIWSITNAGNGDSYGYNRTANASKKLTWGGFLNDFVNVNFDDEGTGYKYGYQQFGDIGDRINALRDYYLALPGVDAGEGQIVISKLDIKNSKIAGSDDTYNVTLDVVLNHGADDNDDVKLNVYVNGNLTDVSVKINEATEYSVSLEAKANDKIKVEVTGMQNLERGVYFYAPKPQDIDGDGIATSREVSQNLIGVAAGETPVHAERTFTVDIVNVDLEINKVDTKGNPLTGAKFAIYDEEGNLIDDQLVGADGKLVFSGLIPGKYSLKELIAPNGYYLPKEAIEVIVHDDGSITFDGKKLDGEKITSDPVVSEGEGVVAPDTTVDLVPGGDTEVTNKVTDYENAAKTLFAVRKVTATMTEVKVEVNTLSNGVTSILPALKFDRNSTADQTQQKKDRELYTDNGHFHDPDTFTVTDAPAGYPFKYVGHGDYSGHYISHIRVIYAKDEAGNAIKDENGNYVIDHLEHVSSGTPLHYNGELSTNVQGPFHYATGTRPQQFLLKNENGDLIYGYCIDLETGANSGTWYAIANLEDNDYYASEEAENHIRNIIENGYWGTESGTGSLESLKAALKTAVANGVVDKEYDVNLVNRKQFTTGYELQEGEYHYGNYVYWNVIPVDGEDHVVLTDDVIDGLTEGEALDAMQMAIWTFANGAMATLDGKDDVIVGDPYAASSQLSDSLNGKNDFAGAARTKALYNYLISLDEPKESSVVINDKTFAENMSLTVGNKIADGIYEAALSFSLAAELGEQDNLTVKLTYVDAYGETQTIELPLTGEGAIESVNGMYTIEGLALRAGEEFDFSLNIYGGQYLEKGAYILTSQGGTGASQTMVTLAEGMNTVDVTKSASIVFEVDDYAEVIFNRYQHSVTVKNYKIDKTSTELYENKYADVTLSVSGDVEYNVGGGVDIVIALGSGIANKQNTYDSVISLVEPLIEKGIDVKLGLIAVEHYDDVAMELTLLDDNYKQIISDGLAKIIAMPAGPTNLHGNILAAKAMLDADVDVPAENKFFYVVGTGRTYNFDNEEGVPSTIINSVSVNGSTYYYWGHYLWQSQRGQNTSCYRVPTSYNNDFAAFWADVEKWVEADGDKYAYSFPSYDVTNDQWFNEYMSVNSTDLRAHGIASSRFGWLITDLTNSGLAAIGSGAVPQNALNYERAQYEAYYAYKSMVDAGYTCQTLCSENVSYQNYSPYMTYLGITPSIQLGHSFMDHMAKLSGQEASTVLFKLLDDNGNYEMITDFFTKIDVDSLKLGATSTPFVEDFIGFGEDYDFDFTGNLDKLVLKLNGNAYTTAQVEAMNGADASYTFSLNGKVGFTLDYFKGNGTTGERFVWNFLETLAEEDTVTLTYQLELVKRNVAVGIHKAETNQSATLYPTGDRDYGVDFPVPEVEYVNVPDLESDKKSEHLNGNRFEISIEVPGGDAKVMHDEVILMVDGSYSMDNEWPAMVEAITTIGKTVLDGSGHTQLTLMAFGMGDNVVLEHVKDVAALEASLGALPGNLLYGRSSTNCEAGFTGVAEYIANHDETLGEVNVIFISDGNINTDETPRAFDANWQTWTKFGALAIAQETFGGTVSNGANLPAAFTTVFGDRFDGATREEIISRAFGGEVTEEEFLAFAEQVWTDVYAYSGLTRGEEYPVSDAERAFVKYDKENGTYIQDLFYYTTYKSAYVTYGDRWTRTPAAADALAAMDAVKALYVVDYDGYTSWMDTGITSEKSTFVQSNGIAGLIDALESTLKELALTPYNDVVITDYMSKWVNIDLNTLKIVDNKTGETIWTAVGGWLIAEELRPTAQEIPVIVELVDPADYAAGGADVIGNVSGNIYKLTWYVKDGALLRSDNYKLVYEVAIDTAEEGFQYGTNYPANGNTDIHYNGGNGGKFTTSIRVPNVVIEEPKPTTTTITFNKGDASNISFMLIDKVTGEVEFLYKVDIEDQTSFEIPTAEGKISAVFVKQSTSGMFWFSEEVDEDVVSATVECLKANNPSYKGHNAIAFGAGDHELEFKKNKFVTYTFTGEKAEVAEDTVVEEAPVVDEPVVDEPVDDEPVVEEAPVVEETKKNNGNNKNKNKNKNK